MKNRIYYAFIIILILLMVVLSWKQNNDKIEIIGKYHKLQVENFKQKTQLELIKILFVNQNQLLSDKVKTSILRIADSLNYRSTFLVACFYIENCGSCVQRLIIDLDDFKEKNKFYNILLIGNIPKKEFCDKFGTEEEKCNYAYIKQVSNSKNTLKENPLLFTYSNHRIIKHLFIPELFKNYNEKYFEEILPKLIKAV